MNFLSFYTLTFMLLASLPRSIFTMEKNIIKIKCETHKSLTQNHVQWQKANNDGNTVLHFAAALNNEALVRLAILNNCNVNHRNKYGQTPLHLASYNGYAAIVEYLLKCGSDINSTDADDETPLLLACEAGHLPVIEKLIGAGANVNCANNKNITPIHLASYEGRDDIVSIILNKAKSYIELESVDCNGKTPLEIAKIFSHSCIVNKLSQYQLNKCFGELEKDLVSREDYCADEIIIS